MISKTMDVKSDPKIAWRSLIKRWIWEKDMADSMIYYHLLLKIGYKAIVSLK